jgi:Protein of unknown function (DUF4058)
MPTPFPGMDPYLEEPALWPDVHARLIAEMQAALNKRLRPKYFARVEARVYISDEDDSGREVIVPDLKVTSHREDGPPSDPSARHGPMLLISPSVVVEPLELEVNERRVELIHRDSGKVVTVIEILSPANKVTSAKGRESFLEKRKGVLESNAHWMEIDLLRSGVETFPRPASVLSDYAVYSSRAERRPRYRLWTFRLPDPLPVIGIPLKEPDPDAPLDLRAILETAYDNAAYDLSIDYRRDPNPPLDTQQAAWADALLRERGLR